MLQYLDSHYCIYNIISSICFIQGNCTWEEFGHWDSCSKTCGGGEQSRTRGIKEREAYGGEECTGESTEIRECNTAGCLGISYDLCIWFKLQI